MLGKLLLVLAPPRLVSCVISLRSSILSYYIYFISFSMRSGSEFPAAWRLTDPPKKLLEFP